MRQILSQSVGVSCSGSTEIIRTCIFSALRSQSVRSATSARVVGHMPGQYVYPK